MDFTVRNTSLLKFIHEFVYNKANRVNFDQSSPNGIHLFRMTSNVVCGYARNMLASTQPVPEHEDTSAWPACASGCGS